jgi:hypothetical protein
LSSVVRRLIDQVGLTTYFKVSDTPDRGV